MKVKTELPDDYIQEVIWQGARAREEEGSQQDGTTDDVPAEVCVVIGVRNQQTLGEHLSTGSGGAGGTRAAECWRDRLGSLPLPG